MTKLEEMGDAAAVLAERRRLLIDYVGALQDGIEALKRDAMPDIRLAIDGATNAWSALERLVKAHPELFEKPRTTTMHGIKFGFKKSPGGMEIADPEKTVALIRKHLPDQAKTLLRVVEEPVKDALAQLPASMLKKLGVEVKDTGDVVVIAPGDKEVDKLVKQLVTAAVKEGA